MAPISPTTFVAMLALLLSPASAFVAPAGLAGLRHQPVSSSSSRSASFTNTRSSLRQSPMPLASVRLSMVSEVAEEKVRAYAYQVLVDIYYSFRSHKLKRITLAFSRYP